MNQEYLEVLKGLLDAEKKASSARGTGDRAALNQAIAQFEVFEQRAQKLLDQAQSQSEINEAGSGTGQAQFTYIKFPRDEAGQLKVEQQTDGSVRGTALPPSQRTLQFYCQVQQIEVDVEADDYLVQFPNGLKTAMNEDELQALLGPQAQHELDQQASPAP